MVSRAFRRPTSLSRPTSLLAALTLAWALSACGGKTQPRGPIGTYLGHSVALFDDGIEPAAAGITGEKRVYQPKFDPLFLERAQTSDGVVRVRITTIVAKGESRGTSYVIGCRVEKVLAGPHPPTETFDLHVAPDAPSAGILKNLDSAIVGKRFVAFVKSFVRPDGDSEMHFHFAPDTKEVADAATDANVLAEGK